MGDDVVVVQIPSNPNERILNLLMVLYNDVGDVVSQALLPIRIHIPNSFASFFRLYTKIAKHLALRRCLAIGSMFVRLERLYVLSKNVANKEIGKTACTDTEKALLDVFFA